MILSPDTGAPGRILIGLAPMDLLLPFDFSGPGQDASPASFAMGGVLAGAGAEASPILAVIGFSFTGAAADKIGRQNQPGYQPGPRPAVLMIGLFHGMGLSEKPIRPRLPGNRAPAGLCVSHGEVEISRIVRFAILLALLSQGRMTADAAVPFSFQFFTGSLA